MTTPIQNTFVPRFPAFPTLADSILKSRRLTGSNNSFQITDTQIVQYMQSFYMYDLPAKFRSLKLKDIYTFTTNIGQDVYPFNSELYTTVDMPCYCAKRELKLFTDPWSFYGVNYNWQFMSNFATGDGSVGGRVGVITAITQATQAQITSASHGLTQGNRVLIQNVVGMIELNGNSYTISSIIDANNFTINVNSSAFTAYISDGSWSTSPYDGFVSAKPLIASVNNDPGPSTDQNLFFPQSRVQNLIITANVGFGNTQTVTDDGQGNLIQIFQTSTGNPNQEYGWTYYRTYASATPTIPGNGTINYATGEINGLAFNEAIPQGTPISIQYNPVVYSIPLSIMFYQNQFTMRPVPDKGYTVELTCYRQPIQALLAQSQTDNPELSEWWEIMSVGAAKKIFEDRLDTEGVMFIDKMLKERYDIIESRTYAQISQQRIETIYTDQLTQNYGNNGFGGGFGAI